MNASFSSYTSNVIPLDRNQRAAVGSPVGPIIILGAPGSGKTHALIGRVNALIRSGASPDTITYLTHSSQAAATVRWRMSAATDTPGIMVCSVSEFASHLLRQEALAAAAARSPDYTVWDRQDTRTAVQEIMNLSELPNLKGKELDAFLDWQSGNQVRHRDEPRRAAAGSWHDIRQAYGSEKTMQNIRGLDDLVPDAINALENSPQLRSFCSEGRTMNLLVDDFQDITPRQYDFIRLLTSRKRSIAIATDPNGCTQMSREASGRLLELARLDYAAKSFSLAYNHRSTGNLVRLADAMTVPDDAGLAEVSQRSIRPDRARAQVLVYTGSIQEMAQAIVTALEELHKQDKPWEDMALLYRRSGAIGRYRTLLTGRGIPYRVLGENRRAQQRPGQGCAGNAALFAESL